jgi:AAA+ ATPase superfamily predicted ATPase
MSELIIGRKQEISILQDKAESQSAEFIAIYGRRRIGKTYLIKHFFNQLPCIFYEQTGINDGTLQEQLAIFSERLSQTFYRGANMAIPKNWMEAFQQLTVAIDNVPKNKRIVIFFDELPWIATHKSGFLKALEYYWNTNWTNRRKLILIVCGSAASWMLEHLIYNKGGLHNRITARIPLQPFTLSETEEYLNYRGLGLNREQIVQLYMVMGGIPHYLKGINKGSSAIQNINRLCFHKGGFLFDEFDMLFHSLYEDPEIYIALIEAMSKKPKGISRDELIKVTKHPDGGRLNSRLRNLEEAGFISSFLPATHIRRGVHYRIIDEYVLFYTHWIEPLRRRKKGVIVSPQHWESLIRKPIWFSWAGQAFEAICFKHIEKIKKALGMEHIAAVCSDWQYRPEKKTEQGAQIDLVFDREDGCVTLCEIKYSDKPFILTKEFFGQLKIKEAVYKEKTRNKKQIFWALIAAQGVPGQTRDILSQVITLNDLF